MKRIYYFLLVLIFLTGLISGCSRQREAGDNTAGIHGDDSGFNKTARDDELSEDVETLPCIFNSLDEMVLHIRETSGEETTDATEGGVELGALTHFYAPDPSAFPGYKLFQIEVLPEYIIYYYTPGGEEEKGLDRGITVTYCRRDDITLSTLSAQLGIKISEDNFLYDPDRGDISFVAETSVITVHVPKSMNDYNQLKSACSVEKIAV